MLFLLNGKGELQRLDNDRVFQGSNNATELGVIYPYSGVSLAASFTLPNGITTDYTPMPPLSTYTLKNGGGDVVKTFDNLYYTSIPIPNTVTALQGVCKVTVAQTAVSGTGAAGSIDPAQVDVNTSYSANFMVEYASLPEYTVPDDPTEEDFQQLITLLQAYQATVTGNVSELQGRVTTAESNIKDLQARMTTAETDIDNAQADIEDLLADVGTLQGDVADLAAEKQDKTDPALKTDDKTVVGAINAIYNELIDTSGTGFASRLDTAEAEINVLDSRVEDVEEKTAMPLMTDFTVDVATSSATKFYNDGTSADVSLPTGDTVDRINYLTSASFTEGQWAEQSDGTYSLTLSAEQTGRTNNKYVANLEVTDGTAQVLSADKIVKNEDGSITLKDYTEPWSGRVITVAAGQHGTVTHFGTALTGTGEQTSADETLRAATMVGDVYINTSTFEYYKCTAVSTTTSTWEYLGSSKGAQGAQGAPGKDGVNGTDGADGKDGKDGAAATIQVGTVTTGAAGSEAVVTNVGTANAAILNFTIPRGAQGERGIQGEPGAAGKDGANGQDGADGRDGAAATVTVGQVTTLPAGSQATVTNSGTENAAVLNFAIPQGAQGAAGADGTNGTNGADGEDGVGIETITAAGTDENGGNIYRINLSNGQNYTFTAPKGAQGATGATGATGAPGKDFRIYKTYASIAAMNADAENVPDGEFVSIASNENDPDNGKVYQRSTDGETDFVFIFDLSGARGIQGEAATIQIGQVLTGEAGTNAIVTNVGTENAAILNFTIPRGATGAAGRDGVNGQDGRDGVNGQDGADGAAATIQIGEVVTGEPGTNASVENTGTENAAVLKFTIPRGATGARGAQGAPGQNGADGAPGAPGADGKDATIAIGTVSTGAAGSEAAVTNTGTPSAAVFNFTIPRGDTGARGAQGEPGAPGANGQDGAPGADGKNGATFTPSVDTNGDLSWSNDGNLPNPETVNLRGAQGEAATVQVGQVTTLPAGSQATVTNSGTNQAAVLNFGIPTGATGADGTDGAAATIAVGEVTTGAAGTQASVTNSGTTSAAVLDFTIPQGADGASGVTDVTAGSPTEQNGYTVTPVTFNFEQGNSKTVNIQAKNGDGAGVQQNAIINRTASVTTADENSPDFVENGGNLWVKKIAGDAAEADTLSAVLPIALSGTSAAAAQNGKIYVFGGRVYEYIIEFDPVVQTVRRLEATLPNEVDRTSAATAPNEKIYMFGGFSVGVALDDIVEFDPVAQTATTLEATLPSARGSTSAAAAQNGKIYVFGGKGGGVDFSDIVEFDPVTQSVTTLEATLPRKREGTSAAAAQNGKIYIFGGYDGSSRLDDIVEFDPVTQSVTTLEATLPSGRRDTSAATAPNGKIYIFGGDDGSNELDDIVEFDPVTQSVTTLEATLPSKRELTSAAAAQNGKIYVFGGSDGGSRLDDIVEVGVVAQYAYSPAVVLSQAEYTQLKNILQGIFAVGISAPSAAISGTLEAGNTTVNGTLTATGDISTVGGATVGADLSVMGNATAQNVTASGAVNADSAEISGALSAGNTTVNGTLSASGAVTVDGAITAPSFNATT